MLGVFAWRPHPGLGHFRPLPRFNRLSQPNQRLGDFTQLLDQGSRAGLSTL
jgi:hypothetical protein